MSDSENPTKCDRCGKDLEGRYTQTFKLVKGKPRLKETFCDLCDQTERWNNYAKTGVICTRMYMDLIYLHGKYATEPHPHLDDKKILEVVGAMEKLKKHVRLFENEVWLADPPLGSVVDKCQTHGMKYEDKKSKITFMTYDIAGRVMITIQAEIYSITLITGSGDMTSGHMGIQGIYSPYDDAAKLLDWAIANHETIVQKIKSDSKVNMGI